MYWKHLQATSVLPRTIVVDNGPELAGRALETGTYANRVELRFIRPGKPIKNPYIESFNGKFRDECLTEHWFVSVAEANVVIKTWRINYNTVRPHASLDQLTPAAYAEPPARAPGTSGELKNADGLSRSV